MTTHLNNILYALYLMFFCFFVFFCNILFSFCQYAPYHDMICLSYVVFDSLILLYLFIYTIIILYLCSYIFIYFNFLGWGLCSECSCLSVCVLFVKKKSHPVCSGGGCGRSWWEWRDVDWMNWKPSVLSEVHRTSLICECLCRPQRQWGTQKAVQEVC